MLASVSRPKKSWVALPRRGCRNLRLALTSAPARAQKTDGRPREPSDPRDRALRPCQPPVGGPRARPRRPARGRRSRRLRPGAAPRVRELRRPRLREREPPRAERQDVLAGLCWMLTLLAYQRYAVQPALRRYLVTLLCFALGLMSKPMVVTLPLVLLLLDAWPLGRLRERGDLPALAWEKAPFFALAAGAGAITFWAQRRAGAVADLGGPALGTRAAYALVSAARYILQTAWPSGLAIFYPFRPPSAAAVAGAAAALGGISLVVALVARRHPAVAVGWLWYLLTLLPVIGLLQVGNQGMADRYTYIPSVGLFIAVAWGLPSVLPLGRQRGVLLGAVGAARVVACMAAAARQARVWRDSRTLFAHALGVTTDNYVAHNNLGRAIAGHLALYRTGMPLHRSPPAPSCAARRPQPGNRAER